MPFDSFTGGFGISQVDDAVYLHIVVTYLKPQNIRDTYHYFAGEVSVDYRITNIIS